MTATHRGLRVAAIVAGIAVALVLVFVFFPWNTLRGPLASYLSDRLDRQVTLAELRVHPGWTTRVELIDLALANAPWSDLQPMARAQRVALTFSLPALFRLSPDSIALSDPKLVLERNRQGEANWRFGNGSSGGGFLGAINVDQGDVRYRDPTIPADITLAVRSVGSSDTAAPALRFTGKGSLRDDPFTLRGEGQGLSALRRLDEPYRLAFDLQAGRTAIAFEGTVVPSALDNVRGALKLSGPDLSQLYPFVPSPLPWTPPYRLAGELSHENQAWNFHKIEGTVGESDLAGDFTVDLSKERPRTIADLTSRKFDYKDLGGFVGLPPGEPGQKAKTTAQRKEAAKRDQSNRALPDKAFHLAKLREHDVDVKFRGNSFKWGRFPLDNLVTHIVLKDGVMHFEPLDFGVADGHVVSKITLDANAKRPKADGDIDIRRVELKRLFPQLASPNGSAGRFGGRARFKTEGDSIAQMLAAMDGEGAIAMRGGEASTLRVVLTNLDLARAVPLLLHGDEKSAIRCAIAAVHAKNGVLTPDLMVADTSEELIHGDGSVDFAHEKYDLRLQADSKKPSMFALRGPVLVTGTFTDPVVRPAAGPVVARVGAAIGLGLLAPPLALLPLIDLGNAPDANCRALYAHAEIATDTKVPPSAAPKNPTPKRANSKSSERVARSAQ